jgi:hypothetical protein
MTDESGAFALLVIVHDTDRITIVVEAPGYVPHQETLTGVDLVAGLHLEIELTLIPASTVNPR